MGFVSVPEAAGAYRQGRFVIIVDDEDRENEGDLCLAAEHVTPEPRSTSWPARAAASSASR